MTVIEIERTEAPAPAAVAGRRNALQTLGTDTRTADSFSDVLDTAKLRNWNVRLLKQTAALEPVLTEDGVTALPPLENPEQFMVVRTSPFTGQTEFVGSVGRDYRPHQNEEVEAFMQALVGESGGQITSAADYYRNGKQVFFTIDLPASVKIGGVDLVDHNLTVFTSHDGSIAVTPVISNIRAMCANMRSYVLGAGITSAKFKHTSNLADRLAKARTALGIAWAEARSFDEKAEKMLATPLDDKTFLQIVDVIWKQEKADTPRAETMKKERNAALLSILHGITNANIAGTAWAGYSALTEYDQHHASVKGNSDTIRAIRTLRSPTVHRRADQAEKLLLSV